MLPGTLVTRLQKLARGRRQGVMGVQVVDEQGQTLFSKRSGLLFNPASNVKLVTVAAALSALGPAHRFRTELRGELRDGRIEGPLLLKGGGDPDLETAHLRRLVTDLRERGVREVRGPIIIDDSIYKIPRQPPGFSRFRSSHPFRAPPGALSLNANVVRVTIAPTEEPGPSAVVHVAPESAYTIIEGRLRTSGRRTRLDVRTVSRGGHMALRVRGRIKTNTRPRRFWRRVQDPGFYAGHTLLALLQRAGVKVELSRVQRPRFRPTLPLLACHLSPPLVTIARDTLKYSSNVRAELLWLALGRHTFGTPGTYQMGRRAVGRFLRSMGVAPQGYRLENGSGLSRRSRMRPVDMAELLRRIDRGFIFGPELLAALPVGGQDGTIRSVYRHSRARGAVRAKTGTLAGSSCLSGFVRRNGQTLYFSFFSAKVHRTSLMRRRHVAMTEVLWDYLGQQEPVHHPSGG